MPTTKKRKNMNRRLFIILCSAVISLSSMAVNAKPIKIACIGDSITFGARVKDPKKNAYPAQVQSILGPKYTVMNCGQNGIQMHGYLKRWAKRLQEFQPDIVTIKLGTNDTKRRDFSDPANKAVFDKSFRADTLGLLEFLSNLDSKPKVYLCYPVPVFNRKGKIRKQLVGRINEKSIVEDVLPAITKIAKEKNLTIIDLYAALKGKSKLVPDDVHPGKEGQTILAKTIAAAITGKTVTKTKELKDTP